MWLLVGLSIGLCFVSVFVCFFVLCIVCVFVCTFGGVVVCVSVCVVACCGYTSVMHVCVCVFASVFVWVFVL